jgi:hypothetical protein
VFPQRRRAAFLGKREALAERFLGGGALSAAAACGAEVDERVGVLEAGGRSGKRVGGLLQEFESIVGRID